MKYQQLHLNDQLSQTRVQNNTHREQRQWNDGKATRVRSVEIQYQQDHRSNGLTPPTTKQHTNVEIEDQRHHSIEELHT